MGPALCEPGQFLNTVFISLSVKWLGMGVIGIALAMGLDWCIKAALDVWRLKSGKWKEKKVI